jgi:hypothetical protein
MMKTKTMMTMTMTAYDQKHCCVPSSRSKDHAILNASTATREAISCPDKKKKGESEKAGVAAGTML